MCESNGWEAASAVAVVAATAAMAAAATAMHASLSRSARRPALSLSYGTAYLLPQYTMHPARTLLMRATGRKKKLPSQ